MRTSKTMKLVNKFVACLLMVAMLFGIASPMRDVQAATSLTALDVTDLYKTGGNYTALTLEFKTTDSISLSETGALTAVSGSGELKYNDLDVTGIVRFRATNAAGVFCIDSLESSTYAFPEATDIISVKGQFTLPSGSMVEFPATTFQYMGKNANNLGYWRVYTDVAESGALNLDSRSLNGTVSYGWGCAIFLSANGYAPAPTGKTSLIADGGKITETDSATGEVKDITSTAVINSGYTDKVKAYFLEGIAPSQGDIITVKGKFNTVDGFSINFKKTSFQYMGKHPDTGYGYWAPYVETIDCGTVTYVNRGSGVFRFSVGNKASIFDEAGGKEVKLRAYNNSGTILKGDVVQSNGSSVDFVYGSDGNCALWGVATSEGVEYTIQGQFSLSNDDTKVINFPKTVFRCMKLDGENYSWVVVPNVVAEKYVDSGTVTLNSASSSPMYSETDKLYFNTEDISLPANSSNDGYLRPVDGSASLTYQNPNGNEKNLTYSNNIFSRSGGSYIIYLLNNAVDGTIVNLQGKFAMADGSIGIDIQPVTFMYVLGDGEEKGYWVTVGTSFTSDVYWEASNAYGEEILAYEATVRLPQNATEKGGVILGNNRNNGDAYTFGVDASGKPYLSLKDSAASGAQTFTFDTNVCTGQWVNIKIVRDKAAQTVNCYIDNAETPIKLTATNNVEIIPSTKATVGGDYTANNANYFKGSIKDVTLYADVACEQVIATYDMSVVSSATKMLDDGNEGKAYEITRTLRWLDPNEVSAPTNYAYSFAIVGDTQAINDKNGNSYKLDNIYDYIVAQKEKQNIQFVFGLGDITENNDTTEWTHAKEQIQKLDKAGIPYNLNRGNHEGVLQGTDSSLMNQYFPYENYKNKWNVYYDGNIENSCQKLSVGSVDYLIFALDYNPSEAVLDWAGSIIETHPNYNVIITTHSYLTSDKEYDAGSGGTLIWNNLVKKYSNIVLVLCGHVYANDIAWNQVKGDNDNTVTQMIVNPQYADAMTSGGTGMVAMLYFSEDGTNVQVRYYSTIRDQYLADTNQFTFNLDVVEHKAAVTSVPYANGTIQQYRTEGNYQPPTLAGYLFAGWFTDKDCTKALAKDAVVDDATTYYAKFVDENVLTVKRQLREGTTTDLRLVTSVDSLLYEGVGFKVAFNDGELKTLEPFKKVYASLFASDMKYRPELISAASNYFAVLTIKGLPEALVSANVNVEVQPYWITLDGTTVEGKSVIKQLIPTE